MCFVLRSIRVFESFGGQAGERKICRADNIIHGISGYWIFWNNGISGYTENYYGNPYKIRDLKQADVYKHLFL